MQSARCWSDSLKLVRICTNKLSSVSTCEFSWRKFETREFSQRKFEQRFNPNTKWPQEGLARPLRNNFTTVKIEECSHRGSSGAETGHWWFLFTATQLATGHAPAGDGSSPALWRTQFKSVQFVQSFHCNMDCMYKPQSYTLISTRFYFLLNKLLERWLLVVFAHVCAYLTAEVVSENQSDSSQPIAVLQQHCSTRCRLHHWHSKINCHGVRIQMYPTRCFGTLCPRLRCDRSQGRWLQREGCRAWDHTRGVLRTMVMILMWILSTVFPDSPACFFRQSIFSCCCQI